MGHDRVAMYAALHLGRPAVCSLGRLAVCSHEGPVKLLGSSHMCIVPREGGGVAEMGGDEFVPFPGYLFLRLFFHREMYSGERLELADPAASLPLFLLSKGCSCKKDISMAANGCRKR